MKKQKDQDKLVLEEMEKLKQMLKKALPGYEMHIVTQEKEKNPHIGSSLDDFLKEEGLLDD